MKSIDYLESGNVTESIQVETVDYENENLFNKEHLQMWNIYYLNIKRRKVIRVLKPVAGKPQNYHTD